MSTSSAFMVTLISVPGCRAAAKASREPPDQSAAWPEIDPERVGRLHGGPLNARGRGVVHLISYQQRVVRSAVEKRERHVERAGGGPVGDRKEPRPARAPRKSRDLTDLAERQDQRLVPYAGDALDQVHRGIVQDALGVGAVDEQRRREDGRGGDLVGPRRLAPALAEQHRR